MLDVRVTVPATDRRILIPRDLVHRLGIRQDEAERLSDRASGLVESRWDIYGRPPWRQSYEENGPGVDSQILPLSRYPIEGDPILSDVRGNPVIFGDPEFARVTGEQRWGVYRQRGWARPARRNALTANRAHGPSYLEWKSLYTAGYLMPGQVFTWEAAKTVTSSGSTSRGTSPGWTLPTDTGNPLAFFADADGTTGANEPAWPTETGGTVADNGITWTATEAAVLTRDLLGFTDAVELMARSLVFQPQDGCATYDAPGSTPVDPNIFDNSIPAVRAYK